ncbi:MAG TPA: GspH/FimT family pseudopilin [Gemmatimonadales bacterium]|jgi:prepilin-type N-terminal cleavage/methylation domain-containing protein|nr:GspH/FimT family pseudopilin [Gemmatimonadales bacterium]
MPPHSSFGSPTRSGFGLVEFSLALILLGVLALIGIPRMGRATARHRVDLATALVASDLEKAIDLARREGKPLRIACSCESATYQVTERSGGALRLTRRLTDSTYAVEGLAFSTTPVEILPSGIASAPDTITVSAGDYARRLLLSRSGVKILP